MTVDFVFNELKSKESRTNANGTTFNWYGVSILGETGKAPLQRSIKALLPLSVKQEEYVDVTSDEVFTAEATQGSDGRIQLQINLHFENTPLGTFGDLLSATTGAKANTEVLDAVGANNDDLPF